MPKAPVALLVGGGINLVGGVVDEFLVLTGTTPPEATTSPRIRRLGSAVIIESAAGQLDTWIGANSAVNANAGRSVTIGDTVTNTPGAAAGPGVVIGQNLAHTGAGATSEFVVIGHNLTMNAANVVVIGHVTTQAVAFGNSGVFIGTQLVFNTTIPSDSVTVGTAVTCQGNNAVGIGSNVQVGAESTAVGRLAIALTNSISIGRGASSGTGGGNRNIALGVDAACGAGNTGVILIGGRSGAGGTISNGDLCLGYQDNSNSRFTTRVWYGGGPDHATSVAVPAFEFRGRQAVGTNIVANDVTWLANRATGNAAGSAIIFQTTTPGASGAGQQTFAEACRVNAGTATEPRNFQVSVDKGLWFTNQTSGAGVGAGTLTNAPTAGDPAFWLRLRLNGVNHFIPCWT